MERMLIWGGERGISIQSNIEGSQYNTISQYNTEISVNLKNVSSGSWKRRLDSRMLWQESGRLSR